MSHPEEVLDFWLGEVGPEGWYRAGDALDQVVRERFEDLWHAAASGGLDHWVEGAGASLAFIVLTDQLPRNMFRGSGQSFATDDKALTAAASAVASGWDIAAPEPDRQFFYLPFMHSEDEGDQEREVRYIGERMPETGADNLLHARAPQRRFGRFHHRNAALGCDTTAEEEAFLASGGYGAIVESLKT